MKSLLILTSIIYLACCTNCAKHQTKDTQQVDQLEVQREKRDHYCATTTDKIYLKRCDKLTFKALDAAFCPYDYGIDKLEWYPGQWFRDEQSCLADLDGNGQPDSKSECSGDGLISLAHYWISKGKTALPQVERTIKWLDLADWVCGEGDESVTKVWHLQPLLYSVREYLKGDEPVEMDFELVDWDGLIPTHNKYLTAMIIYAKGRMEDQINSTEKAAIKQFFDSDPSSCVFAALYHRFHEGDQDVALKNMEGFTDAITYLDGYAGWGSFPYATAQKVCTAILEGQ